MELLSSPLEELSPDELLSRELEEELVELELVEEAEVELDGEVLLVDESQLDDEDELLELLLVVLLELGQMVLDEELELSLLDDDAGGPPELELLDEEVPPLDELDDELVDGELPELDDPSPPPELEEDSPPDVELLESSDEEDDDERPPELEEKSLPEEADELLFTLELEELSGMLHSPPAIAAIQDTTAL